MGEQKSSSLRAPEICPVCGEEVPRNAGACPECGADHRSGWRDEAEGHDAVNLPDETFNYEEFVEQEFGSSPKPTGIKTIWWVTALVILIAFVAFYLYAAR
ncbi:MAG: zinc ribbon domain-containing protein [Spartobacteria bacterium]